ncbi:uncharacterized protein F5147DRAFT_542646, partial [Suillus discolor]
ITIVDSSGVDTSSIQYCQYMGAQTPDKQLFQIGLFAASFTCPKTAFTFALLDNFILDNLECSVSYMIIH